MGRKDANNTHSAPVDTYRKQIGEQDSRSGLTMKGTIHVTLELIDKRDCPHTHTHTQPNCQLCRIMKNSKVFLKASNKG